MVKFSKQFEAQLVPEWKEAFVDYIKIKNYLNKFHLFNSHENNNNKIQHQKNSFSKSLFSIFMKKFNLHEQQQQQLHHARRHKVIQVHRKLGDSPEIQGEFYETELFEQFGDNEGAIEFFLCLDHQLNKVNQFYKVKEKEFVERGEYLKKQMEFLIELNAAIRHQQQSKGSSSHHSIDDDSITAIISNYDEESTVTEAEQEQENWTYETDSSIVQFIDSSISTETDHEAEKATINKKEDGKLLKLSSRVFKCKGKNLRINFPLTNPIRTFSAITYLIWDDLVYKSSKKTGSRSDMLLISRKKLVHAEKIIRGAFIDLYKGLGYLTTYRNLNMHAFVKILAKFDKVTNKQVLPIYLRAVETSYFNSSDKVVKLTDEIEEKFVNYFGKDNKRKAMKYLKPEQRKESHVVTFFLGLFTGCFLALLVGYVIMAHITGIYQPQSNFIYMETAFPVLSMFSLLFLHIFMYGCNIYMWRKSRINYSFIFELCPTKEVKYRDVFLICAKSMTVVVGMLFLHLFLFAKGYNNTHVQAIPGILLLVFLILLICPFNIMYKSSRYRLLSVLRNIIFSPLYKVVMLDFFMADQLCSQVPMLRNLEYIACYYITRSYKTQDYGLCMRNQSYRDLAYAVSFLPYYWRAMQCARRWFDEGQKSHLMNLGKYVSAMLAAGAKVAYEKDKGIEWLCILVIVSSCATVYQLYWDFVMDWGVLQFNSKNPWLRDDLMLSNKFFYYFSMAMNLVLRLAWLQTIFPNSFGNVDYRVTGLLLAAMEIVRRGQWNFYRLENEHLSNAGKFRAVKTVPLPFHEVEEED